VTWRDVLAALLADPERTARVGAAQGLGDAGRPDASALRRFKLLAGDAEPEVVSALARVDVATQRLLDVIRSGAPSDASRQHERSRRSRPMPRSATKLAKRRDRRVIVAHAHRSKPGECDVAPCAHARR
jgi:hypothetical protein